MAICQNYLFTNLYSTHNFEQKTYVVPTLLREKDIRKVAKTALGSLYSL